MVPRGRVGAIWTVVIGGVLVEQPVRRRSRQRREKKSSFLLREIGCIACVQSCLLSSGSEPDAHKGHHYISVTPSPFVKSAVILYDLQDCDTRTALRVRNILYLDYVLVGVKRFREANWEGKHRAGFLSPRNPSSLLSGAGVMKF